MPCLSAVAAAPAHAAQATIDGSPLNVTPTTSGFIQVAFDGSAERRVHAAAGRFGVRGLHGSAAATPTAPTFTVYGVNGGLPFTPAAAQPPTLAGSGSAADPFVLTSNYDAISGQTPVVHVTQT